jgi:tetratricopeptide (TPR) repeat protein
MNRPATWKKSLILLSLITLCLVADVKAQTAKAVAQYIAKGDSYFRKKNYQQAKIQYTNALNLNENCEECKTRINECNVQLATKKKEQPPKVQKKPKEKPIVISPSQKEKTEPVTTVSKIDSATFYKMMADGKNYYSNKQYDKAFPLLYQVKDAYDPVLWSDLGYMYYWGEGTTQSHPEAFKWYLKSANAGYQYAQFHIALAYRMGYGVDENASEAAKWARKSADQGNAYGQNEIGEFYFKGYGVEKNLPEAVKWFQKSAAQNNKYAQNNLAEMYEKGLGGLTKDINMAVSLYRKAAKQDISDAKNSLKRLGYSE